MDFIAPGEVDRDGYLYGFTILLLVFMAVGGIVYSLRQATKRTERRERWLEEKHNQATQESDAQDEKDEQEKRPSLPKDKDGV